jgi:deoxyribonuclease IV
MNIGAHVRGGGKLIPSLEYGVEIGATSIQIFTQSPRIWKPSQYSPEVLSAFRDAQAAHPVITDTFCHATYLINLASPDKELYAKSVATLTHNLSVGRGMASSGVILHVGSHLGAGFETVIAQIAEAFEKALEKADRAPAGVADCPILIENAAGTGGTVGRNLEEIEAIISACGGDNRIGLCIDTQHLWASGVDYSSVAGTQALIDEIDFRIGIERLKCFHLNDSKIELGGNRDRHANIDEGTIGTDGLAPLVGHPLIRELPLLLEVPGTGDGPRALDVVAARHVVDVGVALYDSDVAPRRGATARVAKKPSAAKTASTRTPRKSPVAEKVPVKKAAVKKTSAKKAPAKKAPAKKAPAKKVSSKKIAAKQSPSTRRASATRISKNKK